MTVFEEDLQETDVPELAVLALQRAQRRVRESGLTYVVVRDGQLIRIAGGVVTILKQMPPRKTVPVRIKRRKP